MTNEETDERKRYLGPHNLSRCWTENGLDSDDWEAQADELRQEPDVDSDTPGQAVRKQPPDSWVENEL